MGCEVWFTITWPMMPAKLLNYWWHKIWSAVASWCSRTTQEIVLASPSTTYLNSLKDEVMASRWLVAKVTIERMQRLPLCELRNLGPIISMVAHGKGCQIKASDVILMVTHGKEVRGLLPLVGTHFPCVTIDIIGAYYRTRLAGSEQFVDGCHTTWRFIWSPTRLFSYASVKSSRHTLMASEIALMLNLTTTSLRSFATRIWSVILPPVYLFFPYKRQSFN